MLLSELLGVALCLYDQVKYFHHFKHRSSFNSWFNLILIFIYSCGNAIDEVEMDILNTLCMILAMCNGGSAIALVWGVRVPLLRKEKFFSSQRTKGFFLPRPRPSEDIRNRGDLITHLFLIMHIQKWREGATCPTSSISPPIYNGPVERPYFYGCRRREEII